MGIWSTGERAPQIANASTVHMRRFYASALLDRPSAQRTSKAHNAKNELSILKFEDLVKQELLSCTFNYIHGNLPVIFENYFHHRWALGEALAGNKRLRFIIPMHTTKTGENTVKVQASKVFNDLAIGTSINCNLKTFRKSIKTLLLNYAE